MNISLVFITQSYFRVPRNVGLNTTHFFIMRIPNKSEIQQTALNHSSDIDFKDVIKIYKKFTGKPIILHLHTALNNTALTSDDPLSFRKNIFNIYNRNHDN